MEDFISVDCECGGPTPEYNLCSIGACEVANPKNGFYIELKPLFPGTYIPEALAVGNFTIESMKRNGTEPYDAMVAFEAWLKQWDRPKMVGFNAPFDWQYINYYFWKFLKRNPLGINCVDTKALYMGYSGCDWKQTTKRGIPKQFLSDKKHSHNALDDAQEQAEVFSKILRAVRKQSMPV